MNIDVLTYTSVERVEGESGNFNVTLTKKPRYIIEDKCTGCTTCVEYCPVSYPDKFNQDISVNKAVHIYYSQAVPLVAYIDESCLYLKEEKCQICKNVCKNGAIDFSQADEKIEINVGAIILAPGFEPFSPGSNDQYGYGRRKNVVTSMDYERLMCATGPYEGKILRASDMKHPHNIAWIQCIGSRQTPKRLEGGNSYCSAVCCAYTQKQVILTKDHDPDVKCTVFHNDIRAFGKDFESFYQKAENLSDVRFIRSYVSVVKEDPATGNITIRHNGTNGVVEEEEFDMVVLSVGLNPPVNHAEFADTFRIELNEHGFCKTLPANPMQTTRPGVFVSGAFQGPIDIPESVFTASAAGSQCGELLNSRRGELSAERVYPPETDVSGEEPRIGVFVCHCGSNISRVVDVPSAVEYALTLPHVVYAKEQLFSCATNSAKEITETIKEKGLNRVVLAACSPRTLDVLFRDTVREGGMNQYYFEFANIREHCSWVHTKEKDEATKKAFDLISMSVARAALLEPLQEFNLPVNKNALVIGGGVAGMTSALTMAKQGHKVHLLEKEKELGGMARRIHTTLDGMDVQTYVKDLTQQIYQNQSILVYHNAEIEDATGYIGNFVTTVKSEKGVTEILHGTVTVATGADVYEPTEYLYGQDKKVMTHLELEEKIAAKDEQVVNAQTLVMIQCVGCRNEERNYCSRTCCSESIKNALALKDLHPEKNIYILYRDLRTYGYAEDYYRKARGKKIRFIRYEPDDGPVVENISEKGKNVLRISVTDQTLQRKVSVDTDILALAAAALPSSQTKKIAKLFGLSLSPDGFFKEAHVKLKPVEFAADGVFLCGSAHYPKMLSETISQAYGAAGRALTVLSQDTIVASGSVCDINEAKCIGCGACVTACTYGAIKIRESKKIGKAAIIPVLCKGCGLCNAKCPTAAIQLKHFTDQEIISQIDVFSAEKESEKNLVQLVH